MVTSVTVTGKFEFIICEIKKLATLENTLIKVFIFVKLLQNSQVCSELAISKLKVNEKNKRHNFVNNCSYVVLSK